MFMTNEVARVAVVGDIHHNTLAYSQALKSFGEMGANILFLLGDCSIC